MPGKPVTSRRTATFGAAFAAITFAGLLLGVFAPQLIRRLSLPSGAPFGARYLYAPCTYWLLHGGLWHWFANAILVWLASRFLTPEFSYRWQVGVAALGIVAGGISYETLSAGQDAIGSSMAAYSFIGAVAFRGWFRWTQLRLGWRIFVALATASLPLTLAAWTPIAKSQFVAAAVGFITAWWWTTTTRRVEETTTV
jgi:hypothetical protein